MSNPFGQVSTTIHDVLTDEVDGEVLLGPPGPNDPVGDPIVNVHLLGVMVGPRQAMADARSVELEYLVSVLADGSQNATLLYDVCQAIERNPELDLSTDPVPIGWWSAFGVQPRPAVRVSAAARIDTPFDQAPLVTEPVVIRSQTKQSQQPLSSTARKG